MSYVAGISRAQIMLFPKAIDDYITAENPVRFIDAFSDAGKDYYCPAGNKLTYRFEGREKRRNKRRSVLYYTGKFC